jgi:AcrR family transcriptional regulator
MPCIEYWGTGTHVDAGVKATRRYDGSARRRRALESRAAILSAAQEHFLARGYAATTLGSIAERAAVSVETIYKAFGNKAGLLRAVHDQALIGDEPVPAYQRADAHGATHEDPRDLVEAWGRLVGEVMPRVAPILLLVRAAAATAPEVEGLWRALEDRRLERMGENARHLADRGQLRDGCTWERAREVLWAYTSPELFERLVLRQGWTPEEYGRFVAVGIAGTILP